MQESNQARPIIKIWIIVGMVMIFMQIILGGITRLTGSGLSITKWDIVTGAIPPLNESQWNATFELYRQTPQYQKINNGMTLSQFKWIFFWEYLHRLWARSMGFVFLFPFLFFWIKGWLNKVLKTDLIIVFLLSGVVGLFGWIMVASGLVNRPWVNAYKLSMHLGLALIALCYLFWTYLKVIKTDELNPSIVDHRLKRFTLIFLTLVSIQILLGGMMSGMKAALMYPTFPMMNDHWIDPLIFDSSSWKFIHFVDYDSYPFLTALVQVLHRSMAFVVLSLFILGRQRLKYSFFNSTGLILTIQILLGILTLINSKGHVPIALGVMHQGMGILLLLSTVKWFFEGSTQSIK